MKSIKRTLSLMITAMLVMTLFTLAVNAEEGEAEVSVEDPAPSEETVSEEEEEENETDAYIPSTQVTIKVNYGGKYIIVYDENEGILSIEGQDEDAQALVNSLTISTEEGTPLTVEAIITQIIDPTPEPVEDTTINNDSDTGSEAGVPDEDGESDELEEMDDEALTLELTLKSDNEALMNDLADALIDSFDIPVETEFEGEEGEAVPENIQERFELAAELGITPGHMRLLEKYLATLTLDDPDSSEETESPSVESEDNEDSTDPEVTDETPMTLEDLAALSVKDLMAKTKANRKAQTIEEDTLSEVAGDESLVDSVDTDDEPLPNESKKTPKKEKTSKGKSTSSKGKKK